MKGAELAAWEALVAAIKKRRLAYLARVAAKRAAKPGKGNLSRGKRSRKSL